MQSNSDFETCTKNKSAVYANRLLSVVIEKFTSMILPRKDFVALLASALPVLFSSSHVVRGEIVVVQQSMPHGEQQFRALTSPLGWVVVPTPSSLHMTAASVRLTARRTRHHHWQHRAGAQAATSTSNAPAETKRLISPRTASSVRSRPKSRRRSALLYVAGVEGSSGSAGAATGAAAAAAAASTSAATTTAAEAAAATGAKLPAAAAAAAAATAASAATAPPTTTAVIAPAAAAAGVDRGQQASREVATTTTAFDTTRANGGGVGSKALVGGEGGEIQDYFAATAAAMASMVKAATVDEGEHISRQLESVISREAEVAGRSVRLRVATLDDFSAIADVRFDVFSPVHSNLKRRFRKRSCVLMKERRRKGAFCLVAALEEGEGGAGGSRVDNQEGGAGGGVKGETAKKAVSVEQVLGTLECSRHEFDFTPLEIEVEKGAGKISRLYLTEVAVRSDCRNLGLGSALLGLVDDVAKQLETCEVFLHVNEINAAGLRLYERCGYTEAPNSASNRAFTSSLGLAEGFIGQRHLLLCKTFKTEAPSASPPSTPAA